MTEPSDLSLPPAALPVEVRSVVVLDYHRRPSLVARFQGDAGLLLTSAAVMGLLGLGVVAGLVRLLVSTWPDFGVALIAVPVGLVALAFWSVAYAAARAVVSPNANGRPPKE